MTEIGLLLALSGDAIALTTAVVAAVAAALSASIAAWQGVLMKQSERKRTQPVVVVYERGPPEFKADSVILAASVANESAGPAFNVRFGVRVDGLEVQYTPRPAGAQGEGDVPRALGPGRTLPDGAVSYPLVIPTEGIRELDRVLESRVYWCRYENAFGDGWETANAWRPEEELHIRAIDR